MYSYSKHSHQKIYSCFCIGSTVWKNLSAMRLNILFRAKHLSMKILEILWVKQAQKEKHILKNITATNLLFCNVFTLICFLKFGDE